METERLILRRYAEEDRAHFIVLFTDDAVMKYVGDGVLTVEQAEAFWLKLFEKLYPENFNIWAVFAKEDSVYVGHAGIYPRPTRREDWEFVYFLNRNSWGKGYATEIARRLIRFAFEELNLPEVFATVDDEHSASIRVLEKAGMSFKNYEYDEQGRFSVYSSQNRRLERRKAKG
ncbi:MAG: GNAT family N-acetyltransferase [Acidobacteriota bacterium]|nr:GNAT family N-acetyltransferase [Acidobacteriota bacterium]